TLVVHRADMFGLSQLYQIRGRIGRSKQRGYAYLTIPPRRVPTIGAERRLEVMQSLDGLGAGFSIASHDMDIRGAGNLLGEEQSGHVREVGLELYQQMLEDAVAAAKHDGGEAALDSDAWSPQIQIGTSVLIPDDLSVRMGLYRRLSQLSDRRDVDSFGAEMIDRFGSLPAAVEHLLQIVSIKQACLSTGVERIEAGPRGATLSFRDQNFANPAGLVGFISNQAGTTKLRPDHKLVYLRSWESVEHRLAGVQHLMDQLVALVEAVQPTADSSVTLEPKVKVAVTGARH
ncbi:MAG: transcription-repair coupling factor, partial [Proteobacteria bacterium]|nr:transcription-repair coupling factor [Pseudomonadota bacterium]